MSVLIHLICTWVNRMKSILYEARYLELNSASYHHPTSRLSVCGQQLAWAEINKSTLSGDQSLACHYVALER